MGFDGLFIGLYTDLELEASGLRAEAPAGNNQSSPFV